MNPETRAKLQETSLKKYGTLVPNQSQAVREKMKNTLSKRTKEDQEKINEKRKQTCLKTYGVETASQIPQTREKLKNIFQNKSDEEWDIISKKRQETCLKKYGVSFPSMVEEFKVKSRETRQSKSEEEIEIEQNKRKETCKKKYGAVCALLTPEQIEKTKIARRTKFFNNRILPNTDAEPLFTMEEYLQEPFKTYKWKCHKCGDIFESKVLEHQKFFVRCLKCHPLRTFISSEEIEVAEFIKSIYPGKIEQTTRSIIPPCEIDMYIPEKKLAIEYDGLYWHSENMGTKPGYHKAKTIACEKKGIRLVHVFENEWLGNRDLVESRLADILDAPMRTIDGNLCEVKEVPYRESETFLMENDLKGTVNAKRYIGLYNGEELVSMVAFGHPKNSKDCDWQMLRWCPKMWCRVKDWSKVIIEKFVEEEKPKGLIAFDDRRWSMGDMFKKMGFRFFGFTRPNFWYWNIHEQGLLESRLKYTEERAKIKLTEWDDSLDIADNMQNNGYYRIFDCGGTIFKKFF